MLSKKTLFKIVKDKVTFNERFFFKNWLLLHATDGTPNTRHGVTRKRRELKDEKDIRKLFKKTP